MPCLVCRAGNERLGTEAWFEYILVLQIAGLQRRYQRKPGNHKFQWTQILDINASVPKSAKKAVQQQGIFQSKLSCRDDYIGKKGLCTENVHEAHLGWSPITIAQSSSSWGITYTRKYVPRRDRIPTGRDNLRTEAYTLSGTTFHGRGSTSII